MKEKELKKVKMVKPYYVHKGKRYGFFNEVLIPFEKKLPFWLWQLIKTLLFGLVLGFGLEFLYHISKSTILKIVETGVLSCICIYLVYLFIKAYCCMSCFYCADSKEEVEQYIEVQEKKGMHFKDTLKDIVYEDGWYMLFQKEQKEIWKDMLQRPNVYIRECPAKLKRLCSKKFTDIIFCGAMILAVGTWFLCTEIFLFGNDLTLYLSLISYIPLLFIFFKKDFLFEQSIKEFCEEENFPQKEYHVRARYDKDEGGRLVFTVTPKKNVESKKNKK